ncbi:MAG: response regulator, partial [Cyclobacteriaceae bacterium]|nr:response regulator [Cyclobacteriaceae bacterium HetDA_MAG_MS6]
WIGTIYGFLECYDPETNKFESFKIGEWIWDIEINEENSQIWCATENGLCVLDLASKEKHCFQRDPKNTKSISHNRTWTIFQDSKLQMWVGTYNGLELYREGDQGFLLFNDPSQQSLSIYSIQEDQHGKLWLGTQQGISKFDPSTTTFQHFTKEDGAFPNAKWSYKDRQGLMYFGGVNGVNVFNPEEIQINHEAPTLVFTDFKIFNESIDPSESAALRKPISSADQIHLKYWQNVFSIEFAALNFTSSQKNSYAYKLEGFSDTWTHIGNERTASYTNLDHGQYTFHVIGANNDKVWNDASISIIINIAPPFWDTWWFRTLLVFTLLSFIVAWIKVRTNMIKLKKKELEELVVIRTSELQLANTTLEKQKAEISLKNQDLKDMAIQVEKSSQMKINFFTNISHELRTPLSLILAPLEKLSEEFKDHPKLSQVLQMMQSNTVRLLRLINQLLDLSKVDGGFMRLEVAEGSISVFIEKIYESFKFLANRHKISYSFENNLKRPKVFFDPDKLEKILYNVIINAFKFTPEGGSVKVQLSEAKDHPDQIRISVHDTGQGIESNDIERIFDRFAQGENDQTYRHMPGKGIGLALAQRLAELHHGQIQVNSKKGIGTTFDIYLGVTGELFDAEQIVAQHLDALAYPGALENQNTQETQRDIQDTPEKTDSELPKILVVEDHPDLRQFISMELSGYFNVETAADGEEGWSACLEFLPDIILSDVMMPHVSGIELCNRIKSDNRTSHMQVVLLTAKATTEDEKLGLECGADDYILKPFSTQLLQLKVRNLLDTRRRIQEKYKTIGIIPKITSSSEKDEKLIKSAVEIIENNLDNSDLDPSLMSIELGLSRSLLYTKVKSLTGMSVNEFIKDIRLKKAAHILRHYKDVSISEVASKVGFANHSHFTRIFKEQFGTSPKEYISDHSM